MAVKVLENRLHDILHDNGIELTEIDILYPSFETEKDSRKSLGKINSFCLKQAQLCYSFAQGKLHNKSMTEFENNTDRRKRFTYKRYIYSVIYKITYIDLHFVSIRYDLRLMRAGRQISSVRFSYTFDLKSGRICPIYMFTRQKLHTSKQKFALKIKKLYQYQKATFYLDGTDVVIFEKTDEAKQYTETRLPIELKYTIKRSTRAKNQDNIKNSL